MEVLGCFPSVCFRPASRPLGYRDLQREPIPLESLPLLISLAFGIVCVVSAMCFVLLWGQAYHQAPTESWSEQLKILQPWWFFDKSLDGHPLEQTKLWARVAFFLCVGSWGLAWLFHG